MDNLQQIQGKSSIYDVDGGHDDYEEVATTSTT